MTWRVLIATLTTLCVAPSSWAQPESRDASNVAVLLDGSRDISRAARLEAARRLAQSNTPADRRVLLQALQERSNQSIQSAAANAIAESALPDPMFIDPLFVLIQPDVPIELARPAARALAKYRDDPTVLSRLASRTQSLSGEPSRRATIEALGYIPEKRSAERLVQILVSPDSSVEVRSSTLEALRTMTGITAHGNDIGRWQVWWQDARGLGDSEFRSSLQASKAARLDDLKVEFDRVALAFRERCSQMYRALPPERRTEQLLDMLNSSVPIDRAVAAMIVREDKASAAIVPEPVQQRLRAMVNDLDDNVRLNVANALGALNYTPAFDAIVRQLAAEPNPDVRVALTRALAPMQNLQAVAPLLDLLVDADLSVAREAALALRDIGPRLRASDDAALLARAAGALRAALGRNVGPAGEAFREAIVDALIPLRRQDLIPELTSLLRPRETAIVRRNAVRALAEFQDEALADAVAPMLADTEPIVRLAAAQALGSIGRAADILALRKRLDDPDVSVQAAAWNAIAAIMPKESTSPEALRSLAAEFSGKTDRDRGRRLEVFLALQNKIAPTRLDQLAEVRQDIGQTYMDYDPPQANEAVTYFRMALDNYKATNSRVGEETMTASLLRAYLKAGLYADAMRFASEAIAEEPGNVQTVGSEVKAEVDRLFGAQDLAKALDLIAQTESTLTPPLPDRYRSYLNGKAAEIHRITGDEMRNRTTAPSGPRGASKPLPPFPVT